MSGRALALVWGAALGLAASIAIALAMNWKDRSVNLDDIPASSVVVIGSSLMHYAVPAFGKTGDGLLGDGRPHVRLAINSISEAQAVAFSRHVLASGAETVFVEANALAFDFAYAAPRREFILVRPLMQSLFSLGSRATGQLIWLLGRTPPPANLAEEAQWLDVPKAVRAEDLAKIYPLHLRPPKDPNVLQALREMAKAKGAQLILIAPPRSQLAADAMGPQATLALQQHLQNLGQRLGLEIFQPGAVWSNDHFFDQAHMNRRGRARFMQELKLWWARRP